MPLPYAEVMIHQPSGGFRGQASDIQIHAEKIMQTKERLNSILAENTGRSIDEIRDASDRDNFMTADEAKEFGLIDNVIYKR